MELVIMVLESIHWDKNTSLEIMFYGFQGLSKCIILNFKNNGLDHIESNIVYLTISYY
jgi:hypothetical protein